MLRLIGDERMILELGLLLLAIEPLKRGRKAFRLQLIVVHKK
jgi:hypothetical protein